MTKSMDSGEKKGFYRIVCFKVLCGLRDAFDLSRSSLCIHGVERVLLYWEILVEKSIFDVSRLPRGDTRFEGDTY